MSEAQTPRGGDPGLHPTAQTPRGGDPGGAGHGAGTRAVGPLPWLAGTRRVFDLSLGQMFWSRRTLFMALVVGGPVCVAAAARIVDAAGLTPLRVNGARVDGAGVFGMMIWVFFVRFSVPVLGVFYGTSLIADEVENKTITYLFTRPVRRGAVLAGKYLAYVACTTCVVLPAATVAYLLLVPFREMAATFDWFLKDLGLLVLGLAVYGALFALVGAVARRPLVMGFMFVFGFEQVALLVPGYLKQFTIAHYLQALVPHAAPSGGIASIVRSVLAPPPSAVQSLFWLLAIGAGCLILACRAVESREYVLDQ